MNRPWIGFKYDEGNAVLEGDCAEDGETRVLCVPLTRECRDRLYDRLVLVFDGMNNRYELASLALDAIGIEAPRARKDVAA